MASKQRSGKNKKKQRVITDKHVLYSAAVQSVDADLDFFARIYKRVRGRPFRLLREDFCGTAALACSWVSRQAENRAWGVDLDRETLDWGIGRYVSKLGTARERLTLICDDVLRVSTPKVDVVCALNFSYCVFKRREELGRYFRVARAALRPGGMLFVDAYGGTEAICEDVEKRPIPASRAFDGTKVPKFTYVWEQASFNPIDHHTLCHIHFKLRDGRRLKRAFTYDWRLWTLPELRELMLEAGFRTADVYLESWDDDADDTDGVFRRRTRYENMSGWVAYLVGAS